MRRAAIALIVSVVASTFAAAQSDPISHAIKTDWQGARKNIVESAEQMPEANYAFKPVDTVRTFGAILAHVAGANYVFCAAAPTYNFTAHPKVELRGTPLAALVDKKGKKLGEEIISVAAEGKIGEVDYMYPRPGETEPVEKVTFVTKAGNEICGVGYYK